MLHKLSSPNIYTRGSPKRYWEENKFDKCVKKRRIGFSPITSFFKDKQDELIIKYKISPPLFTRISQCLKTVARNLIDWHIIYFLEKIEDMKENITFSWAFFYATTSIHVVELVNPFKWSTRKRCICDDILDGFNENVMILWIQGGIPGFNEVYVSRWISLKVVKWNSSINFILE